MSDVSGDGGKPPTLSINFRSNCNLRIFKRGMILGEKTMEHFIYYLKLKLIAFVQLQVIQNPYEPVSKTITPIHTKLSAVFGKIHAPMSTKQKKKNQAERRISE